MVRLIKYQIRYTFSWVHMAVTVFLIMVMAFRWTDSSGIRFSTMIKGVEIVFPLVGVIMISTIFIKEKEYGFFSFTGTSLVGPFKVWIIRLFLIVLYMAINIMIFLGFLYIRDSKIHLWAWCPLCYMEL